MEISFHSHLDSNIVIATKFCTWHDSCAVVACAKICCGLVASYGIMTRRRFHRIWIEGKKTLVKRAPDLQLQYNWVNTTKQSFDPNPSSKSHPNKTLRTLDGKYHPLRTLHGLSQQKWSMRTSQHLYILLQMPKMPRQTPHLLTMPPKLRQQATPSLLQHHYNKLCKNKQHRRWTPTNPRPP